MNQTDEMYDFCHTPCKILKLTHDVLNGIFQPLTLITSQSLSPGKYTWYHSFYLEDWKHTGFFPGAALILHL